MSWRDGKGRFATKPYNLSDKSVRAAFVAWGGIFVELRSTALAPRFKARANVGALP